MLSRDEILARKTNAPGPQPYQLSDGSGEVMIRGLSVRERQAAGVAGQDRDADGVTRSTALIIAAGLVEPALSLEDVEAWCDTPGQAEVVERLANKIADLSGLGEGAGKSGVPAVRRKSRS
jgi:hypothetical protein